MIGQTISHYKILEKLGEGGMGVVYKAHDTKLDRTVALKFLPSHLASDPEDKNRFIHEAKAASALDHPNICTIYEVDETADGQMFIAMAHYEGTPLSKRIERGPLKLVDAVDIATQIAEGLNAAHAKRIVHRDIKSSNIIVTQSGHVKVLDFGLARKSGLSKLTKTGSTLGTAPYMSPEQARGEEVDNRTDLWSLGIVLYEMLTGRLPFRGEHDAAILYSIVNEEPRPLEESVKDASPEVIHIVRRLLEKDTEDRYQSAADLLIDLRRLKKDTSQFRTTAYSTSRRKSAVRRRWIPTAGLVVVVAAVFAILLFPRRGAIKTNPNYVTRLLRPESYRTGATMNPSSCLPGISPDGNWVSYAVPDDGGHWSICYLNVSWDEPRRIPVQGDIVVARISPDGAHIAIVGKPLPTFGQNWLRVVSTNGGGIKTLEDTIFVSTPWHPNGNRIGYIRAHKKPATPPWEVWSVNKDGTDHRLEFSDTIATLIQAACWSPNGESVAWIRQFPGGYTELMTRDLRTGEDRQLTFDKKYADEPFWMSNGNILFASDRSKEMNLWAIPARGGDPVAVTTSGGNHQTVSVSGDGKRILVPETDALSEIWISDLADSDRLLAKLDQFVPSFVPVAGNTVKFVGIACAPDFSKLAFARPDAGEGWAVYVADKDGTNRRRIAQTKTVPIWQGDCISFDGKWIAYDQDGSLYIVETTRPGIPKQVCPTGTGWSWTEEGDLLVFTRDGGTPKTIQYSMHNAKPKQIFEDSTFARPILHGRYLYYRDLRKGRGGRWIAPLDRQGRMHGQPRKFLSLGGSVIASRDYRVFLYENPPGEVWKITLPECKDEYVGPTGHVQPFSTARPNIDGTRVAYMRNNTTLKLILIENLFE